LSVTVKLNHEAPCGSGGGGRKLQLTAGIDNTGPDVVWLNIVATV
jgi:hypothetical protein